MPASFGVTLEKAFGSYGQLCVGIDAHQSLLEEWSLPDSARGLEVFANKMLDAAIGRVGIIKPQVSFFERHGSAGFVVLEKICERAAETDLVVIMDAKRGDIDTTMQAYFDAWLGSSAPFLCSALTVSPFLGFDSLLPTMSACLENGKGLFLLAATSNKEGQEIQRSMTSGVSVARQIWDSLEKNNLVTSSPNAKFGSFGAVIGATLHLGAYGLGSIIEGQNISATPILAPGFGAQGVELGTTKNIFGSASRQVIHNVSRSVAGSGPLAVTKLIDAAKSELAMGLV